MFSSIILRHRATLGENRPEKMAGACGKPVTNLARRTGCRLQKNLRNAKRLERLAEAYLAGDGDLIGGDAAFEEVG